MQNKVLTVWTQLVQLGWDVEEDEPKSEDSRRDLALDDGTVTELRRWRACQKREQKEWGDAWVATGYIFTQQNGEPLHPASVTDLFERLSFEAGLPPIRLHDLRHCAATLMQASGADMKIIQQTLGHSSYHLTANTYTEVLPQVARAAAEAAARIVPRGRDDDAGRTVLRTALTYSPRTPRTVTSPEAKAA